MSPLRNAVLGGLLLALACSSTDPPKSSLGGPGQRAGSLAAPPDAAPVATSGSGTTPGALAGDASDASADSGPAAGTVDTSAGQDAAVAAVAAVAEVAAPAPAQKPPTRRPSEGTPRDLQVLPRSWSYERVEKYMKTEIERGLGVDCAYCHDKYDYAKDHGKKDVARRMMRMTTDLNRQYFKGQSKVTCYSCHKGKKKP